jgi:hypothetical protein
MAHHRAAPLRHANGLRAQYREAPVNSGVPDDPGHKHRTLAAHAGNKTIHNHISLLNF